MPTDYKYIDHERASRGRSIGRQLSLLLILLLLAGSALYGFYFFQTRNADELILTAQYAAASEKLDHWQWLPLVNGRVADRLGTIQLLEQGGTKAVPYFKQAERRPLFRPIGIWEEVLKILWAGGRYEDGLIYADHLSTALENDPLLHFYRSGFLTGENQLDDAAKELTSAGKIPELTKEIARLKAEIDQRKQTGQYAYLIDRENLPVVNLNLQGEPSYLTDSITPAIRNSSYDLVQNLKKTSAKNQAVLTIDYRIQNEAIKSLAKYAGAIVLLNVKTGDILAAASSPAGINSNHPADSSLAVTQQYEPGSIIKMITLAGSLEKGVDLNKILPLQCDGNMILPENKILYDWKKHDQVKDINTATAVSCNVAFAKIGLAMKPADLLSNLKQFGFNSRLNGTHFSADLGKILDAPMNDQYLANLSIGLEHLQMTPLHAAMLASAIANKGVCITPRLISGFRNVIGVPFGQLQPVEYGRFMSERTSAIITEAMVDAIQNTDGTGRRAAIASFPFAMKTGTAGEGAKGYNAIIIGFGPVPNPKIAFAIVIEHAGKAEWEGARITKLFLESIQGYI